MSAAFSPTRAAALTRLAAFVPHAGWDYTSNRNYDRADATARLSPYLRHRLLSEPEILRDVLAQHRPHEAEKFIQEVFWRSYWKGWLELRPEVWTDYRIEVQAAQNRVQTESGLRAAVQDACLGRTGLACFDHWASELSETGFLHNHARMWFASIWIFTLRLPWALGADLFLRSLLDGDAATNTLSWRWVAGLQTRGKHYLATAENIARYTDGRFNPVGALNETAAPLEGPDHPERRPLPLPTPPRTGPRTGWLIHDEDLTATPPRDPVAVATLNASAARSPLTPSAHVTAFGDAALADTTARLDVSATPTHSAQAIANWAETHTLTQIVLPYAPTGPVADTLAQLPPHLQIATQRNDWDSTCWPHATHGFFRFRKQIPALLKQLVTR